MDYVEIKEALSQRIDPTASLRLLKAISGHVNNAATHNQGRDLVIRSLAVLDQFSLTERQVLTSLVRNVGLFPYLIDTISTADLSDQIAFELHRPDSDEAGIVFHSLQARIYHQLMLGSNVVLSASTSSGKSLIIDEMIASENYKKIAIVVPTLALIDETRRRVLQRFGDRCAVITHPSQEAKQGKINVYVLTQERVNHRSDLHDVEFFVVDEFYKMDLSSEREPDRAVDLNLAFHKLAKTGAQFYLLGPNIQAVVGLDAYEHHFIPSEFSTVAVDVVALNLPTRGSAREDGLIALCEEINEPTIIYCQSPGSAGLVAKALVDRLNLPFVEELEQAASWIAEEYHPDWIVCDALRRGVGIHHGGVPRALQQYFIRLFNTRKMKFLVCTSTIIEGVNTVAKNVIVYDRRKSKNVLEHFTYKNIEGRAGRMNQYFVGKVFVLEELPVDQSFSVEMPIGVQNDKTPMSLLLSLPEEDLEEVSKERVESLFDRSTLSPLTLRANRHVPWSTQEELAIAIQERVRELGPVLSWSGVPSGEQLGAVCDLIFTHLSAYALRENDIYSGSQLALHLNELRIGQDLGRYVRWRVDSRHPNVSPSQAVEGALRVVRNIICQRFPRDLMVVSAIQNDVLPKLGLRSGNYAFFAEQAENLFMPSALFALDEYGIPIQTVKALEKYLMPSETLDEVLQKLKVASFDSSMISPFEQEILDEVRGILFPVIQRRQI